MPKALGTHAKVSPRSPVLRKAPREDSRPSRPSTTPAEATLARILEPIKRREGFRHGWLGDTGTGKTWANDWLIREARRAGIDAVLILDDKGPEPQYQGTFRASPAHLKRDLPREGEDPSLVVFRGHVLRTNEPCSADDVGAAALEMAYQPNAPKVLVSIDELRRAVSPAGREWASKSVPRLFSEGRGIGVSVTWTTQSPQRIPLEAYDQTETIGIFRCGPRAVNYMRSQDLLAPEALELLPTLERGEWMLFEASGAWDGRIYRV